jgi:nitroimidazol reductase NimA-like FMN-containing flavoprotein (pyridoxamine 5'-phosphate oxidase superfamily)
MSKELKEEQIAQLLNEQLVGHLGCHADGVTYVVPVTFVYDGACIYAHSQKGMKTGMMQKNPEVCFQVEEIHNLATWWSVIAWGVFELIQNIEKDSAVTLLREKIMALLKDVRSFPAHGAIEHARAAGHPEAIWYRIKITKKTGRFAIG